MVAQAERAHNQAMDNRRAEHRYLVKEDAFVWDLHHIKAGYHSASIVDVSRNGMRLESVGRLVQGSHIAIDFRGMIVCGTVQYCRLVENRFALGVQIKDVLDPLKEEAIAALA
jgi:PilZ domain-containing protein